IEDERDEIVSLPAVGAVPPHLCGDEGLDLAVPCPERHVHVVVVEGHPGFGSVGGGLATVGLDLDELFTPADVAIERLVEGSVDSERLTETHGTYGRSPLIVAFDDVRRDR